MSGNLDSRYSLSQISRPAFRFIGGGLIVGGTANRLPTEYGRSINGLANRLEQKEWQQWWAKSGLPECQILYWIGGAKSSISVRKYKHMIRASIERAWAAGSEPDPGSVGAHDDVTSLLYRIESRFNLTNMPPLFEVHLHGKPSGITSVPENALFYFAGSSLNEVDIPTKIIESYSTAMFELFQRLEEEDWQLWWENASIRECAMYFSLGDEAPGVSTFKEPYLVTAEIKRRWISSNSSTLGPAEAYDDVLALVLHLQEMFDLPAMPPLTRV